jgi:hypothetical protein
MALHRAATSAAVHFSGLLLRSLRSERTIQAFEDRNEAVEALRTALTEALNQVGFNGLTEAETAATMSVPAGMLADLKRTVDALNNERDVGWSPDAQAHPKDFGIPKEHWEIAQHYANFWHQNQLKAAEVLK